MIGKKKRKGLPQHPQPGRLRYPIAALFRMFVIGSVAIIASVWAIWRHYNVPRLPMVVPVTAAPAASEVEIEP